jgi:hypothetical protein
MSALEYARDLFDRTNIGLILVGMPGMRNAWRAIPNFLVAWDLPITTARC